MTTTTTTLDLDAIKERNDRFAFLAPGGTLLVNKVHLTGRDDLDALAALFGKDVPALIAEVEQLREENARVRDLHSPFKIYEPCGHEHEEADKGVTNVIEVGPVCQDGYMYTVCRHCCTDVQGFQAEECVSAHDHSTGICETRRALESAEVTV